jgi:XTP/dITP diphosphohydrolase
MTQLIFATGNDHKASEVRQILSIDGLVIHTLKDIGFTQDIAETGSSMTENAIIKSQTIYNQYTKNVFSDDSGLEVEVLDMAPGLYSARYAGEHKNDTDNLNKLLLNMDGKSNRTARFRAVVALIWNGEVYTFEGIVNGQIANEAYGEGGFGYDPIFVPNGYDKTFAELNGAIKNKISHRYKALAKMKKFLESQHGL